MSLSRSSRENVELIYTSKFISDYNFSECSFQRSVNAERALKIYKDIKKVISTGENPFIPGMISVCKTPLKYYLVDGLHRFFAYKKLLKDKDYDVRFYVCVYEVENEESANIVFKIINNNTKLEKLPEGVSISRVNPVKDHFIKKYPNIFKSSPRPHRPHISETTFGEVIGSIIEKKPDITTSEIIDKIEAYNKFLSTRTEKHYVNDQTKIATVKNFLEKAKKANFYIGALGNDWSSAVLDVFGL